MKITSNKPEPVEETIKIVLDDLDVQSYDVSELDELELWLTKAQLETLYNEIGKQLDKNQTSKFIEYWEKLQESYPKGNPYKSPWYKSPWDENKDYWDNSPILYKDFMDTLPQTINTFVNDFFGHSQNKNENKTSKTDDK